VAAEQFWPAPAKLNLFLHVVGRRRDGYHLLQTAFQLLDFGDTIGLRPRADGRIERVRGPSTIAAEHDLAVRAARTLQAASGCRSGVEISVEKRIPIGGGLGGGSSDAATVLVALDRLWGLGLGVERLAEIGLGLGADVPLFVRGRSAWAEGVGERLTPLDLPASWYVILDPGAEVATAAVFQAPDLTRNSPPTTISRFLAGEATRNDLEPVVRARFPAVARALDWLAAHAPARLTGSGACVFAACSDRAGAEAIATRCPAGLRAYVARGIDATPWPDVPVGSGEV
jgi:4-diphosphocytidyl-2-C-methyl-D-erythritol kinase